MPAKKSSPTSSPAFETLLISVKQAAAILGISKDRARVFVREENIPIVRTGRGGNIMIPRSALIRAVERLR